MTIEKWTQTKTKQTNKYQNRKDEQYLPVTDYAKAESIRERKSVWNATPKFYLAYLSLLFFIWSMLSLLKWWEWFLLILYEFWGEFFRRKREKCFLTNEIWQSHIFIINRLRITISDKTLKNTKVWIKNKIMNV